MINFKTKPRWVQLTGAILLTSACQIAIADPDDIVQAFEPRAHGPEASAAGLDTGVLAEMDVMFQEHIAAGHLSGVVAMIVRNGTSGYVEAFGQRDIEADAPMERDSLLRIYSMTKPIVAAAAMALYEEDRFGLDDPISTHLPEWADATVKVRGGGDPVPVETPITPRHLMTHTSGISYDGIGKRVESISLDEFSRALATRPLEFQPGTRHLYSYSIDVLGRYIEAIEGKTLDVVLQERFFDPLGMEDTAFWVGAEADHARTAHVYKKNWRGELVLGMVRRDVFKKPASMLGGQGLVSTTDDYARFCAMLLGRGEVDGVRVLQPETVDLMFEDHITAFRGQYGLGAWANGDGIYSWGGYAGTRFWVDRNTNTYVVYMVQKVGYEPPTEGAFRKLVQRAVLIPESERSDDDDAGQ